MNKTAVLLILAMLISMPARAEWALNNDESTLSFVSTKAINAAEAHSFRSLQGGVDNSGHATVSIDLASVDSAIELRDERMREMLFETKMYATATMTAQIDMAAIGEMSPGDSETMTVMGELALHGEKVSLTFDVVAARLGDDKLMVASQKPVIIGAQQFRLTQGIEKLREVAGLPSISTAVPVTFVLSFDAK
jgi:polyisoprenoid-binding protein YceI